MLRLIRIAILLVVALRSLSAIAAPPDKNSTKVELAEEGEEVAEEADDESSDSQPGTGLECSPAVNEVEYGRPIPISCMASKEGVSRVEVRYRSPGKKKYTKVNLKKEGDEWVGQIPCRATSKRGTFKVSFTGRDSKGEIVARIPPIEIAIVTASNEPPPALPGREPPMRCYDAKDCPPELKGSPACPGTKATGGARAWGASCDKTSECQKGLGCISGTCEQPPKCEANEDCASNECSEGVCQFPDEEELASRLGPPKFNWFGLHFGVDMGFSREGVGVCGTDTGDSEDFGCYSGGTAFEGSANANLDNKFPSKFRIGTMRAMLSYERWFGRLSAGARVGWAFGGAPEDFSPIHLEARVQYALRNDVLNKRGRPYLGLAFGMAQVDLKEEVDVIDCTAVTPDRTACQNATPADLANGLPAGATIRTLDAYRKGSKFFFGPTIGYIIAFSNEAALSFNVNVMFPDLVFEPTVGYVMGL